MTGKIGFGVRLQSSNREPLMSALGQKRTLGHLRAMSALPPKADIANYFNALADDIADFITKAPVTVGVTLPWRRLHLYE